METICLCFRCKGKMRIQDYENGNFYNDYGMMPCPECEGIGYLEEIEEK